MKINNNKSYLNTWLHTIHSTFEIPTRGKDLRVSDDPTKGCGGAAFIIPWRTVWCSVVFGQE